MKRISKCLRFALFALAIVFTAAPARAELPTDAAAPILPTPTDAAAPITTISPAPTDAAPIADAAAPIAPVWESLGIHDGVATFRRQVSGSDIIAFKGDGVIDAPPLRMATILTDTKRVGEWADSVAEVRRLPGSTTYKYVEYMHIGMPILVTDRDFITLTTVRYDKASGALLIKSSSTEHPNAPKTKHVRGVLHSSLFTLLPVANGTKTRLISEIHCDPEGSLAKWVVNLFQKSWPTKTFKNLRKQASRKDILESAEMRKLLLSGG